MTKRILIGLLFVATRAAADAPDDRYALSDLPVVFLEQNWTPEESVEFYSLRQGSPLLHKAFFDALEQPESKLLFRDGHYLERFGFLRQRDHKDPQNEGYPVGFVAGSAIELNCAACHTTAFTQGGKEYRIDGGQARIDVEAWLTALVAALEQTLADAPTLDDLRQRLPMDPYPLDEETKFGRFAKRVLANELPASGIPRVSQIYPVVALLRSDYKRRLRYNDYNDYGKSFEDDAVARSETAKHPRYGYTRLDALNAILNQATAEALTNDENAHAADAPVNFPAIWDAPQHHHVQWNGAVDNLKPLGPLGRNTGQVIGVFGVVDIDGDAWVGYDSSVRFSALERAEDLLTTLWSPQWPFTLNETLVAEGRVVHQKHCVACHATIRRDDPERFVGDMLAPIAKPWEGRPPLGTDPLTAQRFSDRKAKVGALAGRYKALPLGERFPSNDEALVPSRDILSHLVLRTVARSYVPWRDELTIDSVGSTGEVYSESQGVADDVGLMVYKARPLNGVWSTAPYLHNGSVPTLAELLKPPAERVATFRLGSRNFDPDRVGFEDAGDFVFDTTAVGNSNQGHTYGTELPEGDKRALVEYLKSL